MQWENERGRVLGPFFPSRTIDNDYQAAVVRTVFLSFKI
jgi:hypothetical protein